MKWDYPIRVRTTGNKRKQPKVPYARLDNAGESASVIENRGKYDPITGSKIEKKASHPKRPQSPTQALLEALPMPAAKALVPVALNTRVITPSAINSQLADKARQAREMELKIKASKTRKKGIRLDKNTGFTLAGFVGLAAAASAVVLSRQGSILPSRSLFAPNAPQSATPVEFSPQSTDVQKLYQGLGKLTEPYAVRFRKTEKAFVKLTQLSNNNQISPNDYMIEVHNLMTHLWKTDPEMRTDLLGKLAKAESNDEQWLTFNQMLLFQFEKLTPGENALKTFYKLASREKMSPALSANPFANRPENLDALD